MGMKIRFLKKLVFHDWNLEAIASGNKALYTSLFSHTREFSGQVLILKAHSVLSSNTLKKKKIEVIVFQHFPVVYLNRQELFF